MKLALLALILTLAGIARTYDSQRIWDGWRESGNLRRPNYAEKVYFDHVLRTRANTWSNFAYVAVGFYGLAFGWRDLRRPHAAPAGYLVQTPALSFLFGAACCALGAGSGFFHASLTRVGQQLDVASMYGPLLTFLAIGVGRWLPAINLGGARRATWPAFAALALITTVVLYIYKWSMSANHVLTTLILSVTILTLLDRFHPMRRMSPRWGVLSVLALVAAVTCRQLDIAGRFSGPDAWFQGHAVWHVLTALSIGCTYLYYRSDMVPPLAAARSE